MMELKYCYTTKEIRLGEKELDFSSVYKRRRAFKAIWRYNGTMEVAAAIWRYEGFWRLDMVQFKGEWYEVKYPFLEIKYI